jgi:hypothetical protein
MKKLLRNSTPGFTIGLFLILVCLLACKKDVKYSYEPSPFAGMWKLQDFTQVNAEDGYPNKNPADAPLNSPIVIFASDGTLRIPQANDGHWNLQSGALIIQTGSGTRYTMKVELVEQDKLLLSQTYEAEGGQASGVNYYTFVR